MNRWELHARADRPHGIYAVGTVVRVRRTGEEMMVFGVRRWDSTRSTRPPTYIVGEPTREPSIKKRAPQERPRPLSADWLDAYTDIVKEPHPLAWLVSESLRQGLRSICWYSGTPGLAAILFTNGVRLIVGISPEMGDEEDLAPGAVPLETRKWRAWACVHLNSQSDKRPVCCSTCRGAHPGRVLSTDEVIERLRSGRWS